MINIENILTYYIQQYAAQFDTPARIIKALQAVVAPGMDMDMARALVFAALDGQERQVADGMSNYLHPQFRARAPEAPAAAA